MADAFVRIGDPERSAATACLEGHLRVGRITPEDFKRRVQRIATCRTVRDLDQVMVGFQQVNHPPELADLGGATVGSDVAIQEDADMATTGQAHAHMGPGWYEVLDPWDRPLGQSPLTLRKARRIGWVLAVAMATFTAAPISFLFPSALELLITFSPILLMIVVSFWMAPNEKKTYRWVASPQNGNPMPPPPVVAGPVAPVPVSGVGAPVQPAGTGAIPVPPPITPPIESVADQPTPWNVEEPTFPTVGEVQSIPSDQEDSA